MEWHSCELEGCDYKAKSVGTLKQHLANIHDIDVKWHHCKQSDCKYKAITISKLKRHKKFIHDITM